MESASSTQSMVYHSPIGPLKLVATSEGISQVKYLFGKHKEKGELTSEKAHCESMAGSSGGVESHLSVCSRWLDAYFEGTLLRKGKSPPPRPKLALSTEGNFFHTVWDALISTGIGDTLSYKELARLSGNPKAARAVGQAVKKHSIPILVPCHRVVRSGKQRGQGVVGNYSGGDGVSTKMWLLEHEQKMVHQH